MPNYFVFPYPTKCATSNFSRGVFCLPFGQNCEVPEDDIVNNDTPWNLRLCQGDQPYCQPVMAGDNLSIQTKFSGDPDSPDSSGVSIDLTGPNGNIISQDRANLLSGECAGFNGNNTYQSFQLDTSFINTETSGGDFRLGFSEGGQSVGTDSFCFVDECSDNTHVIRSEYDDRNDCYGNTYSEGCGYDNSMRVFGNIVDLGGQLTKVYVGKKARRTEITVPYELRLSKPVPPHIKDRILKQILPGDRVFIDDQEVMITELNITPDRVGNMFRINIPFAWTCSTGVLNC